MAERSRIWDSGGGGDASPHSEADVAEIFSLLLAGQALNARVGVVQGYLNELAPSMSGASVNIASGGGICDGHPYFNTAQATFTPTTPSGGTTGYRIVLRASWSAQTVRLTLLSSADGTATFPSITQTPGTTYDVPICAFQKTTGAVVQALVDEREFCGPDIDMLELLRLVTQSNAATGVRKGFFWAPGSATTTPLDNASTPLRASFVGLGVQMDGSVPNHTLISTVSDALKGFAKMSTPATNNNDIWLANYWGFDPQTDECDVSIVISLDNNANRNLVVGFQTANGPADANGFCGFRVQNNGNITLVTDNAGTESTASAGVAGSASPGTVYALRLRIKAGVVWGYVNGTLVGPINTNVPAGPKYLVAGVRTLTTAVADFWYRDFMGWMKAA